MNLSLSLNPTIADINTVIEYACGFLKTRIRQLDKLSQRRDMSLVNQIDELYGYIDGLLSRLNVLEHVASGDIAHAAENASNTLTNIVNTLFTQHIMNAIIDMSKNKHDIVGDRCRTLDILMYDIDINCRLSNRRNDIDTCRKQINKYSQIFARNLMADVTEVKFVRQELRGLPESWIRAHANNPTTDLISVKLKYPDVRMILHYASEPNTRRKIQASYNSRCVTTNMNALIELVKYKHAFAKLAGYKNHAEHALVGTMAQVPSRAVKYLDDVYNLIKAKSLQQIQQLQIFAYAETGSHEIYDHDIMYYVGKLLNESVDQPLRTLFPIDDVTTQMLDIYAEMLSLEFKRVEVEAWHPDVMCYEVYDCSNGGRGRGDITTYMGRVFLDLYARDGKFGHNAEFTLQTRYRKKEAPVIHAIVCIVANFEKLDTSKFTDTSTSTLTFAELTTYFHEFGHAIHEICAHSDWYSVNAIQNIQMDFVEAVSQLFENWCHEPRILRKLTNNKIRDEHLDAIRRHRSLTLAYSLVPRIYMAQFDLELHSLDDAAVSKLNANTVNGLWDKWATLNLLSKPDYPNMVTSFHHVASNNYSARYYGYVWSKAISDHMYNVVFKQNAYAGLKYRREVLSRGSSKNGYQLCYDFTNIDINLKHMLNNVGISTATDYLMTHDDTR